MEAISGSVTRSQSLASLSLKISNLSRLFWAEETAIPCDDGCFGLGFLSQRQKVWHSRVVQHQYNFRSILFDCDLNAPVLLSTLWIVTTVGFGVRRNGLCLTEAAGRNDRFGNTFLSNEPVFHCLGAPI